MRTKLEADRQNDTHSEKNQIIINSIVIIYVVCELVCCIDCLKTIGIECN